MLAKHAIQLLTINELITKGGAMNDWGLTDPPTGFTAPSFNIICTQKQGFGWNAHLQILQQADPGTNNAYYLGPGIYPTSLMFQGGFLTAFGQGQGRRIYVELSQALSNDARDCELEHLKDTQHAYDITLGAIQNKLSEVTKQTFQGFAKRDKAVQAVKNAIVAGLHPRLAALVHSAVQVTHGSVDHAQFRQQLGQLYLSVQAMTANRDSQGWHFIKPNPNGESWSAWSWTEYLAVKTLPSNWHNIMLGEEKDIRNAVRGPQFQVNITPSSGIVKL